MSNDAHDAHDAETTTPRPNDGKRPRFADLLKMLTPPTEPGESDVRRVAELRRTFQQRRFGTGYDPAQVDALFNAVSARLSLQRPHGRVDPLDLGSGQFTVVPGGYYEREVDVALREVSKILGRAFGSTSGDGSTKVERIDPDDLSRPRPDGLARSHPQNPVLSARLGPAGGTGEVALPLLRVSAIDGDKDERVEAVQKLAASWADDPDTLPLLRERAVIDTREEARRAAVQAIAGGWADDPGTLPLLRRRATTDRHSTVRLAAVQAIAAGWADDPGTLPLLRERATTDDHQAVRLAAVQAIAAGWADDPGTLPLLSERAVIDTREVVRRAAAQAIARLVAR